MLQITGNWLGVSTETVTPREGATWKAFERTTISLMVDGPGGRPRIEEIEVGRDLDAADLSGIEKDDSVTLSVRIAAFNTRYGGDYRLTADKVLSKPVGTSWPRAVGGDADL